MPAILAIIFGATSITLSAYAVKRDNGRAWFVGGLLSMASVLCAFWSWA